ncbi:uncharacterized protein LOC120549902 isoform X2 [Perca fluviatilis]|uniref:uncharacterized protein LOC120549902 isoform X2 n=1 Tax=Perca fluviatilis TaxID=8168 RepID=UPI001962D326|nr:uncharacterized protein LOC120549902 isoform X2 [Perca fluviatilis]
MSQREETGDRVHSSETPLHGEHDSQTEAQSNGSSEASVSKSHVPRGDINNRPKRRSSCKKRSTESKDPSTSRTPCKPLNSRNLNADINVSPLRMSTQCPESSDSDASCKSYMSKDNIINFKERRSSLRARLKCTASTGSSSNPSQGRINAKERHSSLQKSPMTSGGKRSSWTLRSMSIPWFIYGGLSFQIMHQFMPTLEAELKYVTWKACILWVNNGYIQKLVKIIKTLDHNTTNIKENYFFSRHSVLVILSTLLTIYIILI